MVRAEAIAKNFIKEGYEQAATTVFPVESAAQARTAVAYHSLMPMFGYSRTRPSKERERGEKRERKGRTRVAGEVADYGPARGSGGDEAPS
jgi:hypothetical protein